MRVCPGGMCVCVCVNAEKLRDNVCCRTSNPMFLTTLLAELRLASSFENLEQDITHYKGAKVTQELYGLIFARWELDQGVQVLCLIHSVLYLAWCVGCLWIAVD